MSKGRNEIEAAVHPVVNDVPAVQAALVMQVPLKLLINIGDDGFEAEEKPTVRSPEPTETGSQPPTPTSRLHALPHLVLSSVRSGPWAEMGGS